MNGEKAVVYFQNGFLCGESVLQAVSEACNIKSELIPSAATGFCGGSSQTCALCGAVAGATIAISMAHGRKDAQADKNEAFNRVYKFRKNFLKEFGSDNCYELTSCDFSTAEGQLKFKEKGLKNKVCNKLVRWCTDKCIELI